MSEQEDLVAVYGAIDRAVKRNPDLRPGIARFLPAYNDDRAVGWFDEFETWTRARVGASPFPDFGNAVAHLAEQPTSGRMAARRLLALGVAAKFDVRGEEDASVDIEAALEVRGIAGITVDFEANRIVDLLTDDSVFASLDDWPNLIDIGVGNRILVEDLAVHAAAPPCAGTLVQVATPGNPYPAAELTTSFTTAAVTLQAAERFLEPSNWPGCSSFWCVMDQVATTQKGTRVYHEVVSLDCHHPFTTWTAEAYLEFALINLPNGARVSYALSNQYQNNVILVDEGSLTVQDVGTAVRVDTVKRIKFNHPFTGPALAMLMCALGYGHAAAHLVLDCAAQHGQDESVGSEFPGTEPPTGKQPAGGDVGGVMYDAVDKFKQCVDDCASAYAGSYEKMMTGDYKADDLVSDMTGMWARYLRDYASFADLAMRAAVAFRERFGTEEPAEAPAPEA